MPLALKQLKEGLLSSTIAKIIGTKSAPVSDRKSALYTRMEASVNELNLIKEGKLKGVSAEDALRDL